MLIKFQKAEDAELKDSRFDGVEYICFPKVDGARGGFLNSKFTGRSGKAFKNTLIGEAYSHPALKGLDGELFMGNLTDKDLCRKTTSVVNSYHWNTNGEIPDWMVFDWVTQETMNMPYLQRFRLLQNYYSDIPEELQAKIVLPPMQILCKGLPAIMEAHEYFVSLGYEGTVLRKTSAPHKNGRSTLNEGYFLRIKDFVEEEAECIGFTEAQHNMNELTVDPMGYAERSSHKANKVGMGMVGCLQILVDDEIMNIGCGCMTHEERRDYFENPSKLIGKWVRYKHMLYGAKDKLRLPQFNGFRADEDL